jgi:hypothetical protein
MSASLFLWLKGLMPVRLNVVRAGIKQSKTGLNLLVSSLFMLKEDYSIG